MDENSGHYVIASSRPPERRPLERHTLVPILYVHGGINFYLEDTCLHLIEGAILSWGSVSPPPYCAL